MLGMLTIVIAACAPAAPTPSRTISSNPPISQPAARKVLTLGTQLEPPSFIQALRPGGQGGGNAEVEPFVHDNLFASTQYEVYAPVLADELPSLDRGTWRVNPDGTMDLTWRLRPHITG